MDLDPQTTASIKIALSAGAGGIVRMFLRPARSLVQTALLLVSCITCGFFGTQPAIDLWGLPVSHAGAVGALLGFIGLSIAEGVLRAIDAFDFRALLASLLKGKT
ncbi:MAG TPA: hypothetical protein VNS79_12930 [Sphingobium sp.]|nr:hypothetical protein [Sphingobium sp.]